MKVHFQSWRRIVPAVLGVALASATANADINGFGNFAGFTVNQSDSNSAPTISTGKIRLTNAATFECRSIFYDTPQSISSFTASFTYQAVSAFGSGGGAALVIQDNSAGNNAVSGAIGVGAGSTDISKSAAVTLELNALGSNSASGFYTNGAVPSGSPATTPVSLTSGDPINVSISYDGSILSETLLDTNTSTSYSSSSLANLSSIIGGSTAYIGITAADSGNGGANQDISNFQFTTSIPEPASFSVLCLGAIATLRRRRRV